MADREISIPWAKLAWWNTLFGALYFFRSVSLDIWMASKKTEVEFSELKFGETNLKTVKRLLKLVDVSADSTIYELGCGRGRAAFLFHFLSGAKVIAVDVVGPFIVTGRRLARWMGCDQQVLFCYENLLHTTLDDADLVYACALCFSDSTREALGEKLSGCRPGTHVITVGWNPQNDALQPISDFRASFSWGSANIYVKKVKA